MVTARASEGTDPRASKPSEQVQAALLSKCTDLSQHPGQPLGHWLKGPVHGQRTNSRRLASRRPDECHGGSWTAPRPPQPCDIYPQRLRGSTHPSVDSVEIRFLEQASQPPASRSLLHPCPGCRASAAAPRPGRGRLGAMWYSSLLQEGGASRAGSMCRRPGDHPSPRPREHVQGPGRPPIPGRESVCGGLETTQPPPDSMCRSPDVRRE